MNTFANRNIQIAESVQRAAADRLRSTSGTKNHGLNFYQTQRWEVGAAKAGPCWGSVAHCDWTSPDPKDLVGAERLSAEESVALSQVLVAVVLVLAVEGEVQERQLLAAAALQLQDFGAQVQTALRKQNRTRSAF